MALLGQLSRPWMRKRCLAVLSLAGLLSVMAHVRPAPGAEGAGGQRSLRRRLLDSLGTAVISDRSLLKLAETFGEEEEVKSLPSKLSGLWEERLDVTTPYGPLIKCVELENAQAGKPSVKVHYVNPLGVWSYLAATVPRFWDVLTAMLAQFQSWTWILYQDGATAGNVLATDASKATEHFHLSFDEFGPERLGCIDMWVFVCAVRLRLLRQVRGGLSAVTSMLLMELRASAGGLRVVGPGDQPLTVPCGMGAALCDEAAEQMMFTFKGARSRRIRSETMSRRTSQCSKQDDVSPSIAMFETIL